MATAVKKIVTKTIPDGVGLSLSHAEARTLAEILARVGGDAVDSPRRYANEIQHALCEAGYSWDYEANKKMLPQDKGLYFAPDTRSLVERE